MPDVRVDGDRVEILERRSVSVRRADPRIELGELIGVAALGLLGEIVTRR